ncbi:nucleoside diphosphate kinase 6 isoform X5 [Macaca fascicularis]|uniref:nucleoside diphosphate kinase 6 isoform X5 n=1 Tax=Macaca fascicularis TaxID=9541 RepID=UPI003D15C8F6
MKGVFSISGWWNSWPGTSNLVPASLSTERANPSLHPCPQGCHPALEDAHGTHQSVPSTPCGPRFHSWEFRPHRHPQHHPWFGLCGFSQQRDCSLLP